MRSEAELAPPRTRSPQFASAGPTGQPARAALPSRPAPQQTRPGCIRLRSSSTVHDRACRCSVSSGAQAGVAKPAAPARARPGRHPPLAARLREKTIDSIDRPASEWTYEHVAQNLLSAFPLLTKTVIMLTTLAKKDKLRRNDSPLLVMLM